MELTPSPPTPLTMNHTCTLVTYILVLVLSLVLYCTEVGVHVVTAWQLFQEDQYIWLSLQIGILVVPTVHRAMCIYLSKLAYLPLDSRKNPLGCGARPTAGYAFQVHQTVVLLWNSGCPERIGSNSPAKIFLSVKQLFALGTIGSLHCVYRYSAF